MQNSLPISNSIRIIKGKRNQDRVIKSNSPFFKKDERYKITVSENYILIHLVPISYNGKSMTGNTVGVWRSFGITNSELPYGVFDFHPKSNEDVAIIKIK